MQGNYEEARSGYVRTLEIREHVLGARHSKTVQIRKRLIALLRMTGQNESAAQMEKDQAEILVMGDIS